MRYAVAVLLALLQGGYMLADGWHVASTGHYYGRSLGPWASLVRATGNDPMRIGPAFIILGILWLACAAAIAFRLRYSRRAMITVAILSLWYFPLGTVLAIGALLLVGPRLEVL
jgi:hypothetical protein